MAKHSLQRWALLACLCAAQSAFAADQCEGILLLAKSAQGGFDDITGPLAAKNERGESYQATYSVPGGDCKVFRATGLAPTYECVWDYQKISAMDLRRQAQTFATQVSRCTRGVTTLRTTTTNAAGLPAEWQSASRKYARPVNFTVTAQDLVTQRGERLREISLSVEKQVEK
ncbi:hypothetical protein PMO31116_01241 [Pandoraea morbifera]|uniref:Uncharacterized protein n=1 Tax=Pandoraea morbifera TaxID=2508300 RepID=A0A5E4TCC6_9BURK|nr:hypothetical protein [Pandoraea morbifera]VVD84054.1 hypothetical protein PMO31116_01241 [Pandoraea morbifera]